MHFFTSCETHGDFSFSSTRWCYRENNRRQSGDVPIPCSSPHPPSDPLTLSPCASPKHMQRWAATICFGNRLGRLFACQIAPCPRPLPRSPALVRVPRGIRPARGLPWSPQIRITFPRCNLHINGVWDCSVSRQSEKWHWQGRLGQQAGAGWVKMVASGVGGREGRGRGRGRGEENRRWVEEGSWGVAALVLSCSNTRICICMYPWVRCASVNWLLQV